MTEKILIVGQSPPMAEQKLPYDTTLLYDILSWVGITKERAQNLFEFEALTNVFPGYNSRGGHNKPSAAAKELYWESTLKEKVNTHRRILILGKEAEDFLEKKCPDKYHSSEVLAMIHPSKRNAGAIKEYKDVITKLLKTFIWER